jgi:hypothetical protein
MLVEIIIPINLRSSEVEELALLVGLLNKKSISSNKFKEGDVINNY